MFTITKVFEFSASHQLTQLSSSHPCARLHGHNYQVRVELTGPADERGFVMDYGDLGPFRRWIDATLDHRHLNDVLGDVPPTAEYLSRHLTAALWDAVALPTAVDARVWVSETPKTWAVWSP